MPRFVQTPLAGVAGLAIAAATFAAASAGAKGVDEYDSRVTISKNPPAFHGEVISDYHPCVNRRHVALFKQRSGPDEKLGGDRTGPAGRWRIEPEIVASGGYYSRVRKREQMAAAGDGFICNRDVSRIVVVD